VPGFLVPLNAVEQAPIPRVGLSYLAKLSPINEECLAFFAPPSFARMGVIFCGDSPMGDGQKYSRSFLEKFPPPTLPVVATAPHHGSESNRAAYHHLGCWANVLLWIRTGGSSRHPGATFQALDPSERICSHCPKTDKKRILAGVTSSEHWPHWFSVRSFGHRCVCR